MEISAHQIHSGYYYLPCRRHIQFVPTDVVVRSKTEIDGLNSSGNVLALSSPLLIQIHISWQSKALNLDIYYILLPSVHVQILGHSDTLLVRNIARVLCRHCGAEPKLSAKF